MPPRAPGQFPPQAAKARTPDESAGTAASLIPPGASLGRLRELARGCRACPLWRTGTQTVFGEGPVRAGILLVGEVPGNDEDLAGRPFVGPAGRLLDEALAEAGIERSQVYVTNAVKHFKWEPAGKRRLHKKPNSREIAACRPWLEAEIAALNPSLIVCLGATAARSLLGRGFRVTRQRGQTVPSPYGPPAIATVHPSSILRAPDTKARSAARKAFTDDLRAVASASDSLRRP